jgi:hypothetical protein
MIIDKLSMLAKHKCTLNVDLKNGVENATTTIVAVNHNDNRIILNHAIVIDDYDNMPCLNFEAAELINKKIITAPRVEFSTLFRDIQVAFTAKLVKKIIYEDCNAFVMDIPTSLNWQNRRKHYRKKIPVVDSSFCEIILSQPKKNATEEYKENYRVATEQIKRKLLFENSGTKIADEIASRLIRLSLYDVSLSGCSMLNYDKEFSYFLTPQTIYENCKIIMPDGNEISVSFEIMAIRDFESPDGEFNELVGIKFLGIKRDAAQ